MKNKLREFILEVNKITDSNPQLNAYVEKISSNITPNFWEIIEYGTTIDRAGRSAHETRYSRMIKWLLDPNENHNLKHMFARELIKKAYRLEDDAASEIFPDSGYEEQDIICRTEMKNIDIYYNNKTENTQIAIELKQYSEEHNRSKTKDSQLTSYKKFVDKVAKDQENGHKSNSYLIFLTPLGEEPSEGNDSWQIVDYEDIMEILDQMIANNHDLDFIKVVKDFKFDLEKTGCNVNYDLFKKESPDDIIDFNKKYEKLFKSFNDERREKLILDIKKESLELGLDSKKVITTVDILSTFIQKQDHTPNIFVSQTMQRILEDFVCKYGTENVPKEEITNNKMYDIKVDGLIFNKIRTTRGKGQGILFYYIVDDKELAFTYFSGDYKGIIPNDGNYVSYKLKDNKEYSKYFGKVKMKTRNAEDVLMANNWNNFIEEYLNYLKEFSDKVESHKENLEPRKK